MKEIQAYYFAQALYELKLEPQIIKDSLSLMIHNKELREALSNPVISLREKEAAIVKIFPKEACAMIITMCKENVISLSSKIWEEYESIQLAHLNIMKAELRYVVLPDETQLDGIKEMMMQKFGKDQVRLELTQDESLIGGYKLIINQVVYDNSVRGTLGLLKKALSRR